MKIKEAITPLEEGVPTVPSYAAMAALKDWKNRNFTTTEVIGTIVLMLGLVKETMIKDGDSEKWNEVFEIIKDNLGDNK